jgi:hypothetical protein
VIDNDGIPEDLDRDAREKLGPYLRRVEDLVRRVNRIHWLARAGEPEPWDREVERVPSLAEGKERYHAFVPVGDAVWKGQTEIGAATGRSQLLDAAEDYWIARFHPRFDLHEPSYTHDLLFAAVRNDVVGALREVILQDVVPMRFFRDALVWYERGHWRAAITPTGKRVVY